MLPHLPGDTSSKATSRRLWMEHREEGEKVWLAADGPASTEMSYVGDVASDGRSLGPVFHYSTGAVEMLHVAQPEMVKDMGHWTPSELGMPNYMMKSRKPPFGEGILSANGDLWAYEKKILAPEFFVEKSKGMIGLIVDATVALLQEWENIIDRTGGAVLQKENVEKLRYRGSSRSRSGVEKLMYLPTKSNWEIRKLEVRLLILDLAKEHRSKTCHNDGMHISTPIIATWCLMLLAAHVDWQDRARVEAPEVCHGQTMMDFDALQTLRLYPPASLSIREALTVIKIGGVDVPRGTIIQSSNSAEPVNSIRALSIYFAAKHAEALSSCTAKDFVVCKNIYFAGHEATSTTAAWCLAVPRSRRAKVHAPEAEDPLPYNC
ncbi:hypothetical protein U9M48_005505 [Paspalum notatum var. saurae]|uniref:Cytochrome P450 n=1 Tax=Paspalum notatum var. saurae TaxID=547442 RepID=A0AAQ3SLU5_PASNO